MLKRFIFTLLGLTLAVGALAGTKVAQFRAMAASAADMKPPPMTVATVSVRREQWQPTFGAVGTVVPVRGTVLRAEVAGVVKQLYAPSGAQVKAGQILVQLDKATEAAQLEAAAAAADLSRSSLQRMQALQGSAAVAESELESTEARAKQAGAEVSRLRSEVDKRTIRAPFAGTLGIWNVNLGHLVGVGDAVNSLMALDGVYVDFTLPQEHLAALREGVTVRATCDAFPTDTFEGKLTAIDPVVDVATRSLQLRATFDNPGARLRPGMFVHVEVVLPEPRSVLVVPQPAIIYAPYGDSVFVVEDREGMLVAQQSFVRLGERRGDFVEITKGLQEGATVVSTGAFKLQSGTPVKVNNELQPETSLTPAPPNH